MKILGTIYEIVTISSKLIEEEAVYEDEVFEEFNVSEIGRRIFMTSTILGMFYIIFNLNLIKKKKRRQ